MQGWHFAFCTGLLSCHLVAWLSWYHTVEGETLRAALLCCDETPGALTVYVRNVTAAEMSPTGRVFKWVYLEDMKMRNNLFSWLDFTSLWNTNEPSVSLLNPSHSFSTWLLLTREQQEAVVLSLSVTEGWMVVWLQLPQLAHLSQVITGHSYVWRRNRTWKQIVFKIVSTLNTRKRKPKVVFLWSSQLLSYWGKICSFSEKTNQTRTVQR